MMRRRLLLAGVMLAGAIAASPPAQPPAAAASFEWISGTWVARDGDKWTEERWAPPRGGVLMGTSLAGIGERAEAYEFMRIAPDKDGVVSFWGSPGGAPPVGFKLVSSAANSAVFENPAHDFPTRIAYRRDGEVLTATISGPGGLGLQSWRYERVAGP